jgi:hypothetical protein
MARLRTYNRRRKRIEDRKRRIRIHRLLPRRSSKRIRRVPFTLPQDWMLNPPKAGWGIIGPVLDHGEIRVGGKVVGIVQVVEFRIDAPVAPQLRVVDAGPNLYGGFSVGAVLTPKAPRPCSCSTHPRPPCGECDNGLWWCGVCAEWVEPRAVTSDERHDPRAGGCGGSVS